MADDPTRPVVVGVDGSISSEAAVTTAASEAMAYGVPLRIVHAYVWPVLYAALVNVPYRPEEWRPGETGESRVSGVADRVRRRHPTLAVQTAVITGGAGGLLVAESAHATAVVVGDRGAGGIAGRLTGSVTAHVAAHAHCPVLVVRAGQAPSEPDRPTVVGVDGTPSSLGALRFACDWALRHGATVDAVYAVPLGEFDRPTAELRLAEWVAPAREEFPTAVIRVAVVHGRTASEAMEEASAVAQLVVVGSRHRGELRSAILGSVGMSLIRKSACPVAVVHRGHTAKERDAGDRRAASATELDSSPI